MKGIGCIASCSWSTTRWFPISHVISIDFNTINVSHNSISIVQLQFKSSHIVDSNELSTKILSSLSSYYFTTWCIVSPRRISIVVRFPISRSIGSVFPSFILVDRRIQRQRLCLKTFFSHHCLVHHIPINTLKLDPSTIRPRITITIGHFQSVLIVCRSWQAHFNHSFFTVRQWGKSDWSVDFCGTRIDRKRLFTCEVFCLLGYLCINLCWRTIKSKSEYSYEWFKQCVLYKEWLITQIDSFERRNNNECKCRF